MKLIIKELIEKAKNKERVLKKQIKSQPRALCQCGHCEKCYHRNYMRARRKHMEIENFYLGEIGEKTQQIYQKIRVIRKCLS